MTRGSRHASPDARPRGAGDDSGLDDALDAGTPRWVKVFGMIAVAVVLLFLLLLLTGRGHGPGRHLRQGDGGGDAPRSGATGEHAASDGHRWS